MIYLFTCAGRGSRFTSKGIKVPKPLIKVHGDQLLIRSIRSFPYKPGDTIVIAFLRSQRLEDHVGEKLRRDYPFVNFIWHAIEAVLPGQLLTVQSMLPFLPPDQPICIHNCDTYAYSTSLSNHLLADDRLNIVTYFMARGPQWSFVKVDDDQTISEIREKEEISSNASVGTYIFESIGLINEYLPKYLSTAQAINNEFYIAPFINYLISHDFQFLGIPVTVAECFGTPEQTCDSLLVSFEELLGENSGILAGIDTIVVDIDDTISSKSSSSSYGDSYPIPESVQALQNAHSMGVYIILYTSRNMRTFKGNVGLINKHTLPSLVQWLALHEVPYDELIVGKPWGPNVAYYDDKALNPKDLHERFC
jgi:capsule biosynthesis phosphatase